MYIENLLAALKEDPMRKSNYNLYSDILLDEGFPTDEADLWRILGEEELFSIGKVILENPDNLADIKFTSNPENPYYIPDFILRYVKKAKKDNNRYQWSSTEDLKEDLLQAIQSSLAMGWL